MARKKKGRKADVGGDQMQGGFVPASQNGHKRYAHGADSHAFDPAPSGAYHAANPYSRSVADYSNRKKSSRGPKVFLTLLVIVLVAAVAGLGFYVYKEMEKNAINQDLHGLSLKELQAVDNELTGMTSFDEPFTMLLLGSDARSDDPGMGARTDTIILVRIDPLTNNIAMVSIPRDTMIQVPGAGTQKFNAAYTYGGPSGTIAAVKELCDVDIDHYAEVNFEGLVGLIDAIGGIDVMVDELVDDPDAGDVVIEPGLQHLDGAAALTFSRSRAYADGDFTRVSNQRKVIEAIVHKGLEAPASELYGIIAACTGFLSTDSGMDVDFIFSLADQIRHNNDYPVTITTATLPASLDMVNGVSYVVADPAGVADLMRVFLAGGDVSDPYGERAAEEAAAAAAAAEEGADAAPAASAARETTSF